MSVANDDTVAPQPPAEPEQVDESQGLIGCTLARRYRIESLLGEGGMGSVYRGFHLGLRRPIAVKVLRPELTNHPQIAARFEREAQASSRLEHPNVVQIFDFGAAQPEGSKHELKFLVMQLLEGSELSEMLGQPIPPARALELLAQILSGLAHAHERGIVHRDLKPENVFVTTDHDGRELLKLVDFGIAKLVDATEDDAPKLTQMGMVFGTPTYMSPEQATGSPVDSRTDIYAAGIILYELLAGRPPFKDPDIITLLRQQVAREPPPIEGLDPRLEELLAGLLAKKPDDRIQTASDALERVHALQAAMGSVGTQPTVAPGADVSGPVAVAPEHSAPMAVVRQTLNDMAPAVSSMKSTARSLAQTSWETFSHIARVGRTRLPQLWRSDPRIRKGGYITGGVLAFVIVLGLALGGDDTDGTAKGPSAARALVVAADQVVDSVHGAMGGRATDEEIAQVDKLRTKGKKAEAREVVGKLLEEYSSDGRLHWRLAVLAQDEDAMVRSYRAALEHDPALIEDKEVYTDLASRIRQRQVPSGLIDVAADHVGQHMREVLVERLNQDKFALPYQDRHRLLSVLRDDGAAADLINEPLQDVLDLWQARQAGSPCEAFDDALDEIEEDPDPYHLSSLATAPVPKPGPAEERKACAGLKERQNELARDLAGRFPEAEFAAPADYEKAAKRRRRGGRRGLRGFLGL